MTAAMIIRAIIFQGRALKENDGCSHKNSIPLNVLLQTIMGAKFSDPVRAALEYVKMKTNSTLAFPVNGGDKEGWTY